MYFPMIFSEEPVKDVDAILERRPEISFQINKMISSNLVVFSHVSHIWKTHPTIHITENLGKRNNILIEGFASYLESPRSCNNALLCLFEYGEDFKDSKKLIKNLNIENNVIWYPLLSRKELRALLQFVDIGGSEFSGQFWGGCGWEFITSGVPMLHYLADEECYIKSGSVSYTHLTLPTKA